MVLRLSIEIQLMRRAPSEPPCPSNKFYIFCPVQSVLSVLVQVVHFKVKLRYILFRYFYTLHNSKEYNLSEVKTL